MIFWSSPVVAVALRRRDRRIREWRLRGESVHRSVLQGTLGLAAVALSRVIGLFSNTTTQTIIRRHL
jgi:hypothetical protein